MLKTWKIIKREFKTKVFTKGFLIGTLLGPVFIIGISFGPAFFMTLSEEKPLNVMVVDYSGGFADRLPDIFSDTLKNGQKRFEFFEIEPYEYNQSPESYYQQVESGEINFILVIPRDILSGGSLTYIAKTISDIEFIEMIKRRITEEVNRLRLLQAGFDPDVISRLTTSVGIKTIKVEKGGAKEKGFGQEWATAFIFLMVLYMTILLYGNAILRGVLEEKTSRIVEVLLSSTNSFQLMLGKLFGVGSVGLVQYLIWAALALGAFLFASSSIPELVKQVSIQPSTFAFFIVFFVMGFFQFSTLYAAVGAMSSSQEDAQSLSTPVTLLIVIPFVISFMVIRDPASSAATILSLLPFFTPMLMFLRILLLMPPWWEIGLSLIINIAAIFLFTYLAAKIYRVGILMYGKRPTVPEILRWLRYK